MKRKWKWFACFSLLTVLVTMTGCKTTEIKQADESNGLNFEISTKEADTKSDTDSKKTEIIAKPMYKTFVNESNKFDVAEKLNIDNIEYSNLVVKTSKKMPDGVSADDFFGKIYSQTTQDDGNLLDGYIYAQLDVTIVNNTQKKKTLYLSSFNLVTLDADGNVVDSSSEDMIYRSMYNGDDPYKKDYYKFDLNAGESKNVSMLYIVTNDLMHAENLCCLINQDGHEAGYNNLKAFRVTQVQEE